MKRVGENFLFFILCFLIFVAKFLPLNFLSSSGKYLGRLAYFLLKKRRNLTKLNLSLAFPDWDKEKINKIAKEVFENIGKNFLEFLKIPYLREKDFEKIIVIEGKENLDLALNKGGVILFSAHFGNWELLAAKLSSLGYKINVVGRNIHNFKINNLIVKVRGSQGTVNIPYTYKGAKEYFNCLKRGEILGILLDQNAGGGDVETLFFGRCVRTFTGSITLAKKTNAVLIPVFIIRENGHHRLIIGKIFSLEITGDNEKDNFLNTQKMTNLIEDYIRKYPGQWFWLHNRFKDSLKTEEKR